MPGLVTMDSGGQNGVRTDHDRDRTNGSSSNDGTSNGTDKTKAAAGAAGTDAVVNGGQTSSAESGNGNAGAQQSLKIPDRSLRMNDLPDEIVHITQGFVPLSLFLSRLAQTSHNSLQEKVAELAKMPLPSGAANGHAPSPSTPADDYSTENLRKKGVLLNFAQDMHAKWVKALVIAEWSRKSEKVSKLIDLKAHLDQQRILYDTAVDNIVNIKRDLTYAKMPSPDLKTALQILSTGSAPWLPDFQYIEPPPLTSEEQIKWMHDLDTLLSLRLNLDDYDKIPPQFRAYEIGSGRVTFRVPYEFEVDLTIADEDFEKQFWFIDFRVTFRPSSSKLSDSLRAYLEACVNDELSKKGLAGCYEFLHEFVLTMKINEIKRQAIELSRTSWTGTLNIEPLNRALAIQYWTPRTSNQGLKNWVLVAVNKSRKAGTTESRSSSYLVAKWYRDNKEVKDVEIPLDAEELSAEALLRDVIGRHVGFILKGIHDRLLMAPRFKGREASLELHASDSDPSASYLRIQVGHQGSASLLMETTTGNFAINPNSKFTINHEQQLNNGRNPTEDGVSCLENVRCGMLEDELSRRGSCMGWYIKKAPLHGEDLRSITKTRDWKRVIWLQKEGWEPEWFIVIFLGLGGDEWWLLEAHSKESGRSSRFQARLPLNKGQPDLSNIFWTNLTLFATGMMVQANDMRELHKQKIKCRPNESMNWSLPQQVRLPSIDVSLSEVYPAMGSGPASDEASTSLQLDVATGDADIAAISGGLPVASKSPWANNTVTIQFRGVQLQPKSLENADEGPDRQLVCVTYAVIKVNRPARFNHIQGVVDRDVSYNPKRGEFYLKMRHPVGVSMINLLRSRIKAVDRFVNFLESMDNAKGTITSESVTLRQVVFSYAKAAESAGPSNPQEPAGRWRVVLDLSEDDINIKLEAANPHVRVLDLMKQLVNSDGGIGALMAWLPASAHALKAMDDIEHGWQDTSARSQGFVDFSMAAVDSITIKYWIGGSSPGDAYTMKWLSLDASIRVRKGEPWWFITRTPLLTGDMPPDDYFTPALRPVWEGRGDGWFGQVKGAAGRPDGGIVKLLGAIDKAMHAMVVDSGAGAAGPAQVGNGTNAAPLVLE